MKSFSFLAGSGNRRLTSQLYKVYSDDFHCFEPDMKLIRGIHNLSQAPHGCVLTIGNFDGVHRGHQALLQGLSEGRTRALPVVVMIFEPQPLELLPR
jgi:riboflavin kinase/FMN adenylyltransferase